MQLSVFFAELVELSLGIVLFLLALLQFMLGVLNFFLDVGEE